LILSLAPIYIWGQPPKASLEIEHLTGDLYVFITYNIYKGNPVPSNGMYLITDQGVVMIDTPWDTTQFQPLLDSIKIKHHKNVIMCIATHSHEDRTGGLEFLKQKGIKTFTTKQTDEISKRTNQRRAQFLITKDTVFTVGQYSFQTFYPGQGHTPDNIVIWFNKNKVLYGGCLIKSTEATDLGNIADANIKEYPATLKKIINKFSKINFVIPGHQSWANRKSVEHTLRLLEKNNSSH
jgi:metallo-beta-lactamase class B